MFSIRLIVNLAASWGHRAEGRQITCEHCATTTPAPRAESVRSRPRGRRSTTRQRSRSTRGRSRGSRTRWGSTAPAATAHWTAPRPAHCSRLFHRRLQPPWTTLCAASLSKCSTVLPQAQAEDGKFVPAGPDDDRGGAPLAQDSSLAVSASRTRANSLLLGTEEVEPAQDCRALLPLE